MRRRPSRRAWRLSSASAVPVPATTKRDVAAAGGSPARARRARGGSPSRRRAGRPAAPAARRARRTARAAPARSSATGSRSRGSIPFGIAVIFAGADPEDVRDVAAHVARAGDHVVGAADHRALGGVDVGLRMVLDPALVAAVLGGVDGRQPAALDRAGRPARRRAGDEPVVRVDEIELEPSRTARRRARACRRSSPRPSARTRSRPSGTAARATRWTITPCWSVLGAAGGRPRASARGPRRRRATSCSESLRTWRPSPPSITGGYSQETSSTRIGRPRTLSSVRRRASHGTICRVVSGSAGKHHPDRPGAQPDRPGRADRPHPPAHGRHRPDPRLLRRRARVRRDRRGPRCARLGHDRRHPVRVRRRLPPPPRLQHLEVEGRPAHARRRRGPSPRGDRVPDAESAGRRISAPATS